MKKILLTISYVGTGFSGWQVQPAQPQLRTVMGAVQDGIEAVYHQRYAVTGCSRTDAGVHALRFRCAYSLPDGGADIPLERLPLALNRHLPDDVAVRLAEYVPGEFHPRYDALWKEYRYIFEDTVSRDPFMRDRCWHVPKRLDAGVMDAAARAFVGRHDFAGFMAVGSKVTDTVREVYSCSAEREENGVVLTIRADGFLYNMVRIIAGTLVKVSYGNIDAGSMDGIIASRDRTRAGQTAPAAGLYLADVGYLPGYAKKN
ncbi:MAG: tRNA pseudouridine(38-40) synthase TruA [Clostridiales bacterium]|nr:tRNA pseudouridine(38-40) synthase TruA [Clostridiales bacterium]